MLMNKQTSNQDSRRGGISGADGRHPRCSGATFRVISRILLVLVPAIMVLALWAVFFCGLPAQMGRCMPFTAHHVGANVETRSLVPGDHIQLLYHFWLTREMVAGRTPFFHNLYEFNTGDDQARWEFDPGYIPFSLVYAAVSEVGGHALGWNVAQLVAVLTAFFFLYGLGARYSRDRWTALAGATLAMCLPYQWVVLAGGSPTGFGMAWVPAIALGLDIAVRDGRARGGLLAGVALFFCYTSDLHCLAFGCMLIPAWCLLAWVARDGRSLIPTRRAFVACIRGLWPTILSGAVVVVIAKVLSSFYAGTDAAGGRTVREVLRNSPSKRAMFGFPITGVDLHFRVGFVILIALLMALILVGWNVWKSWRLERSGQAKFYAEEESPYKTVRPFLVALFLFAGIIAVLSLAMGFNAPFDGLPIRIVRKLVPPYKMIRQPIKVFCLLPTLLAPLLAMGFAVIRFRLKNTATHPSRVRPLLAIGLTAVCLVAGVVDTASSIRIGLSGLPPRNVAYEAILQDAASQGRTPLVLALPIWPGDSAWSSLYEYHAMEHRVRMVNGYSAVCTDDYIEKVYKQFESLTQGRLTDEQADALRKMKVTAVVVYAGDFPEKVSPFPVGVTIERLLKNKNLRFLGMDDVVAFAVRGENEVASPASSLGLNPTPAEAISKFISPARRWSSVDPTARPIAPSLAKVWLRSPIVESPGLNWLVRVRGDGTLDLDRDVLNRENVENSSKDTGSSGSAYTHAWNRLTLDGERFVSEPTEGVKLVKRSDHEGKPIRWLSVPVGALPAGWAQFGMECLAESNAVEVLDVFLADGETSLGRNEISLPAVSLFHGGTIEVTAGVASGVIFRPQYDPPEDILYGFNLPLDSGRWCATVEGCFADGEAGVLRVLSAGVEIAKGSVGVDSEPIEFETSDLAPITLRFQYAGKAEVVIKTINLVKIER